MPPGTSASEQTSALDRFLASVQGRALIAARLSLPEEDALDCVQTAMLNFVRRYRDKPEPHWRPLFFRTLYNALNDWHRRRSVRRMFAWVAATDAEVHSPAPQPDRLLAAGAVGAKLIETLESLPLRQQQAFVLRHWEGLDTAATAQAMGVNEGTVKTHLSRALGRLRSALEEHHDARG